MWCRCQESQLFCFRSNCAMCRGRVSDMVVGILGGMMRRRILQLMCAVALLTAAYGQQSHWAAPNDKSAQFMIDMERKWAEGICTNNGVITELLDEDF